MPARLSAARHRLPCPWAGPCVVHDSFWHSHPHAPTKGPPTYPYNVEDEGGCSVTVGRVRFDAESPPPCGALVRHEDGFDLRLDLVLGLPAGNRDLLHDQGPGRVQHSTLAEAELL